MPRATAQTVAERFFLKSLAGAWVELLPMPWRLRKTASDGFAHTRYAPNPEDGGSEQAFMEFMQTRVREMEFKHCIVDHNLYKDEEENDKIDFSNQKDLNMLDFEVGLEIEQLIDKLHGVPGAAEAEDFTRPATSSPPNESNTSEIPA